jgi:hypothetical protein
MDDDLVMIFHTTSRPALRAASGRPPARQPPGTEPHPRRQLNLPPMKLPRELLTVGAPSPLSSR